MPESNLSRYFCISFHAYSRIDFKRDIIIELFHLLCALACFCVLHYRDFGNPVFGLSGIFRLAFGNQGYGYRSNVVYLLFRMSQSRMCIAKFLFNRLDFSDTIQANTYCYFRFLFNTPIFPEITPG